MGSKIYPTRQGGVCLHREGTPKSGANRRTNYSTANKGKRWPKASGGKSGHRIQQEGRCIGRKDQEEKLSPRPVVIFPQIDRGLCNSAWNNARSFSLPCKPVRLNLVPLLQFLLVSAGKCSTPTLRAVCKSPPRGISPKTFVRFFLLMQPDVHVLTSLGNERRVELSEYPSSLSGPLN